VKPDMETQYAETHYAKTRILLDLSHTYFSHYRTGIQRVVRSLLAEIPRVTDELGIEFAAIVLKDNEFVYVDSLERDETVAPSAPLLDVLEKCPKWYRPMATTACSIVRSNVLKRWLLPEPGHQGIFKHVRKFQKANSTPEKATSNLNPIRVEFTPNDFIVMPDGYWVMMHIWEAVARAKSQGARVGVVVHDLICFTHPHFFGPGAKECFTKYLRALNEHADMAIATTQTVEKQLRGTLAQLATDLRRPPECKHFRLGVTIENPEGEVRDSISTLFVGKEKPYLMVSTFEPRKNHKFVLDSFDMFWKRYPTRKLLFVGAVGWMSDAMLQRIKGHPRFSSQLLMVNDASDAEVQHCYENCAAAIYPSFVEGFGLPIIEALRNRKTVFASNTPVHREVGKQFCEYVDLSDENSLVASMESWERSGRPSPSPPMEQFLKSWNESARQLVYCVLDFAEGQERHTDSNRAVAI